MVPKQSRPHLKYLSKRSTVTLSVELKGPYQNLASSLFFLSHLTFLSLSHSMSSLSRVYGGPEGHSLKYADSPSTLVLKIVGLYYCR